MMSRKYDSNPRETSSALEALPTADVLPERISRDALREKSHVGDLFNSHGSTNEDVRRCSDDDDDPDFVIRTRSEMLAKSDFTSQTEPVANNRTYKYISLVPRSRRQKYVMSTEAEYGGHFIEK